MMSRPKSAIADKKTHNELETNAVKANLKEQARLEKNIKVLGLEETYSMRLLQVNNREIRKYCQRLTEKIAKVKSHLNSDEIEKMRELDTAGKLKGGFPSMIPSSASRIAAEARRLKLSSASRPKTSLPVRVQRPQADAKDENESYNESATNHKTRPSSTKLNLLRNPQLTEDYIQSISTPKMVTPKHSMGGGSRNTTPSVKEEIIPPQTRSTTSPDYKKQENFELNRLDFLTVDKYNDANNDISESSDYNSIEEMIIDDPGLDNFTDDEGEDFPSEENRNRLSRLHTMRLQNMETDEKKLFNRVRHVPDSYYNPTLASPRKITPSATETVLLSEPSNSQTETKTTRKSRIPTFPSRVQGTGTEHSVKMDDGDINKESEPRYSVLDQLRKRYEDKRPTQISKERPKTAAAPSSLGYSEIHRNRRVRSPDGNHRSKFKQKIEVSVPTGISTENDTDVSQTKSSVRFTNIPQRSATPHSKMYGNGDLNETMDSPRLLQRPQTPRVAVPERSCSPAEKILIGDEKDLIATGLKKAEDKNSLPDLGAKQSENTTLKKHATSTNISTTGTDTPKPTVPPRRIIRPHTAKPSRLPFPAERNSSQSNDSTHIPPLPKEKSSTPQRSLPRPQTAKTKSLVYVRKDDEGASTPGGLLANVRSFNPRQSRTPATTVSTNDDSMAVESPRLVSRNQTTRNELSRNNESFEQPVITSDVPPSQQTLSVPAISQEVPPKPKRSLPRPQTAKVLKPTNISYPYPEGNNTSLPKPAPRSTSIPRPSTGRRDAPQSDTGKYSYPVPSNQQNGLPPPGPSKVRRALPRAPSNTESSRKGGQIVYPELYQEPCPPKARPSTGRRMLPRPPSAKKETDVTNGDHSYSTSSGQIDAVKPQSFLPRPKTAKVALRVPSVYDEIDAAPTVPTSTPCITPRRNSRSTQEDVEESSYNSNEVATSRRMLPRPQTAGMRVRTTHNGDIQQTENVADDTYSNTRPTGNTLIPRPQTAKQDMMRRSAASSGRSYHHGEHNYSMPPRRIFDSHATVENQAAKRSESPQRFHTHVQDEIGKYLESAVNDYHEDIEAGIRDVLLQEEKQNRAEVDERLSSFIKSMDERKSKRYPDWHCPTSNTPRTEVVFDQALSPSTYLKHRRKSKMLHNKEAFEKQYKSGMDADKLFDDIHKCRYLRVPEHKLDSTGVQTLATDQIQHMKTLKGVD